MGTAQKLNSKWIKASILGTVWASSEIVLGSFLHNLRIPFSGNILTAIGIVILISANYKWDEKGLFWRAGLICALMKTMSPSAVIFGPMIAIFSEALLLEFSVRILGRTVAGFILGSVLAMSWNLFQKIFNYIIFYGYNIVEVYKNLMVYAEKQLNLRFDAVWAPILILLAVYALFGALSALVGIRTGRKLKLQPAMPASAFKNEADQTGFGRKPKSFPYSVSWLILDIVLLVGALFSINRIPFGVWVAAIVLIVTVWAFRYKRALRQLIRPKFWIFFVLITLVTAFVFTKLQSDTKTITDALLIGVEMNLRAIVLIMGFTVLGTELYNPKIREYFAKSYFKQLPLALELSVESLPVMIANTPDLKTVFKNPLLFVQQIMGFADYRLQQLNLGDSCQKIFIVTGAVGAGKTTMLKKLLAALQEKEVAVAGFYSERLVDNGETVGYNLVDVVTKEKVNFLSVTKESSAERVGKYAINSAAFAWGEKLLQGVDRQVVIIDEIGKLESWGEGWAQFLEILVNQKQNHLILSFRKELFTPLIQKFRIKNAIVFDVDTTDPEIICSTVLEELAGK
ncbi:MAG: nucleoside-triphosphatase [Draconibacterium sp.]